MMRLLGFQSPYSPEATRLLGLDPAEMRQQALWSGLANAGAALASSPNWADAFPAFSQGVNQGRDNYMQDRLLGYRMQQDEADRIAQEEDRAWRQQERQRQADELAARRAFLENPTPDAYRNAYPDQWAGQYAQTLFPDAPKLTDDMREYQAAQSQGYQGTLQEWIMDSRRAGATTVNMGGGTDKQIFDATKERSDAARAASTGLKALDQAESALPGAITGAAADQRLALQKIGALLGVADSQAIVDTETFRSAIAPQVAAMLKATVGSTQISNADREFAEKAAAGSISLDGKSIARLVNIMQAANSEIIRQFNTDLSTVYPEGQNFDRERALFGVPNVAKRYPAPIGPQMMGVPPQSVPTPVLRYNPQTGEIE
jgi:hypothetical protein